MAQMTDLEKMISEKCDPEDAKTYVRMILAMLKELGPVDAEAEYTKMHQSYENLEFNAATFKKALEDQKGMLS